MIKDVTFYLGRIMILKPLSDFEFKMSLVNQNRLSSNETLIHEAFAKEDVDYEACGRFYMLAE